MTSTTIEQPDIVSSTDEYAARFDGSVGRYFLDVQRHSVLEFLPPHACRILDVGGGHGQLTIPLVQAGHHVTVLGSDDSCSARLHRKLKPDEFRFVVGNIFDLPFADQDFDIAIAFRMLAHAPDWKMLLYELCRVGKHLVLLDFPSLNSINRFARPVFAVKRFLEPDTRRFRCFGPDTLRTEFATQGFPRVEFHQQFFFPMSLHRLVRSSWISRSTESIARATGLTARFGSPVILAAFRPTEIVNHKGHSA